MKLSERMERIFKRFGVGRYITGLPGAQHQTSFGKARCLVTEEDFEFTSEVLGRKLGSIPRNSINQIRVEDKSTSQTFQRLTATRMLTLGVFSLAVPKRETTKIKEFYLVIDWDDERGLRQNTIFEISGPFCESRAYRVANELDRYGKPKIEKIKDDEKKCPYCAEMVKREAKLCKFCHSQL